MRTEQTHLSTRTLLVILVLSIAAAAVPWLTMRGIDNRLMEDPPNNGIIAFELAGSADNAQRIIDGWGPELSILARKSIRVDFFFIPAYVLMFFSSTMLFSLLMTGVLRTWVRRAAFLPFISGLADIIENIFMLLVLRSPTQIIDHYPNIASYCATVKFALLAFVVVCWIVVLGIWAIKKVMKTGA